MRCVPGIGSALESDPDRSASANRSAMRTVIADLGLSFTPEG